MKTEIHYHGNEQEKMEAARRDIAEYLGKDYSSIVERFAGAIENLCVMTWETWHFIPSMLGLKDILRTFSAGISWNGWKPNVTRREKSLLFFLRSRLV